MKKGVTKQEFIDQYAILLRMTREDVSGLLLVDDETIIILYKNGCQKIVNIAADSGISIIRDVARRV